MTKDQILKALSQINYPGFNRDIVSFGLIDDISLSDENVRITLKLSAEKSKQEEMKKMVRDELESLGKFMNGEVVVTGITQPMGNISQPMKPVFSIIIPLIKRVNKAIATFILNLYG